MQRTKTYCRISKMNRLFSAPLDKTLRPSKRKVSMAQFHHNWPIKLRKLSAMLEIIMQIQQRFGRYSTNFQTHHLSSTTNFRYNFVSTSCISVEVLFVVTGFNDQVLFSNEDLQTKSEGIFAVLSNAYTELRTRGAAQVPETDGSLIGTIRTTTNGKKFFNNLSYITKLVCIKQKKIFEHT